MKLSAPGKPLFVSSLVFFILGLLGHFMIFTLAPYSAGLLIAAWIVLALGCLMRGI